MMASVTGRFVMPLANPFARTAPKGDGAHSCPRCGEGLARSYPRDTVYGSLGVYRMELSCRGCSWKKTRRVSL